MTPIKTDLYRFAYGKPPRGQGNWAFNIQGWGADGMPVEEIVFYDGTYKVAASRAIRDFKRAGRQVTQVAVLP